MDKLSDWPERGHEENHRTRRKSPYATQLFKDSRSADYGEFVTINLRAEIGVN